MSERIKVIGITGGIGSGKSTVAFYLKKLGYEVLFSDLISKDLVISNSHLKNTLIKEFGADIYLDDGNINKDKLAGLLFGKDDNLTSKINSIIHPYVIDKLFDEIQIAEDQGNEIIFVESALMFESGIANEYDYIICVYSSVEDSIKRTIERSSLTKDEVIGRMSKQLSLDEKKKLSDFVINNNSTLEELYKSTDKLIPIFEALPLKDLDNEEDYWLHKIRF